MFDYSCAALKKSVDDVKRASFLINILVNALYILYLVYALAVGSGSPILNAILCALTAVFFVSYIVTSLDEKKKRAKKIVKVTYKRIKIFIDAFSLAIALYSIYIAAERATVISILLTVASLIGWIAKVALSIITHFLEARAELIIAAFRVDFEPMFKVVNAYKKLVGDDVKERVSPEMRAELDELCAVYQEEKEEKKQMRRESRRTVRRERFEAWRSKRAEKKNSKKSNDLSDGEPRG
jgi:hypothetical protein